MGPVADDPDVLLHFRDRRFGVRPRRGEDRLATEQVATPEIIEVAHVVRQRIGGIAVETRGEAKRLMQKGFRLLTSAFSVRLWWILNIAAELNSASVIF